jgi:hypothetical protein
MCIVWISEQTAIISLSTLIYNRDGGCLLRGTDWVFVCKYSVFIEIRLSRKVTVCNVLPLLQSGTAASQRDTGGVSQWSLTAHTTSTAEPRLSADTVGLTMLGTANTKMKKYIPLSSVDKTQF